MKSGKNNIIQKPFITLFFGALLRTGNAYTSELVSNKTLLITLRSTT